MALEPDVLFSSLISSGALTAVAHGSIPTAHGRKSWDSLPVTRELFHAFDLGHRGVHAPCDGELEVDSLAGRDAARCAGVR